MLFYSRKCMSIIKVTLLYTMLQMFSYIGQSFFGTSSLKVAKTVVTKTVQFYITASLAFPLLYFYISPTR